MELIDFLLQTRAEINEEMVSRIAEPAGEMPFPEMIFTETVTRHMADIGMTFEDPQACRYDAKVGNGIVRLSGYAISDESDQLDLFVSLYQSVEEVTSLPDSATKKAAEQCSRFLAMCIEGKLSAKMDQSHEAYPLVLIIEANYSTLEQIRIFILTDCRVKTRQFKSRLVNGKTVKLEVIDIERLFNHWQEGKPRDELVVNFEEVSGGALPCVWVPGEIEGYDYALTVVPGEALRFLYEKYGARILEANVRSFLSQTGKVNKGISQTLREQPERFMAYNNGIVIVADEASLGRCSDGSPGISWLKGMQIVNGGQTTASMYFTKKKYPSIDITQVRVPAKIIVLRETDNAKEEGLVADISRFANSQNAVRQSDLSANRPFHIALEKQSMHVFCPDGSGRWFYERASGSYKVALEREGKTPAGIKRLKESIPLARKITKTDLAKYICAWKQRPDLVSLGGQKNFAAFMQMVDGGTEDDSSAVIDVAEYKEIVAQAIVFKAAQKIIRKQFPAFQANITAYTVAILSQQLEQQIDLKKIWDAQQISDRLGQQIEIWANEVSTLLNRTAKGRMLSEWAKRKECWELVSQSKYSAHLSEILEASAGLQH